MAVAGKQMLADEQARKTLCPADGINRALEAIIYPVLEDPQQSPAYRKLVLRLFLACAPSVEQACVARWERAGEEAWAELMAMVRKVVRFDEELGRNRFDSWRGLDSPDLNGVSGW